MLLLEVLDATLETLDDLLAARLDVVDHQVDGILQDPEGDVLGRPQVVLVPIYLLVESQSNVNSGKLVYPNKLHHSYRKRTWVFTYSTA